MLGPARPQLPFRVVISLDGSMCVYRLLAHGGRAELVASTQDCRCVATPGHNGLLVQATLYPSPALCPTDQQAPRPDDPLLYVPDVV